VIGLCLVAAVLARPARTAEPNNGCDLLPKQQVADILGEDVEKATPWPLAGKFACMYEGDAIAGLDLLVNVVVDGREAWEHYQAEVRRSFQPTPVSGIGDKAVWSTSRYHETVADGLNVLAGSYAVDVSFVGTPTPPPSAAEKLARARALAQRAIANAKRGRF
jgi:hypothetical protein